MDKITVSGGGFRARKHTHCGAAELIGIRLQQAFERRFAGRPFLDERLEDRRGINC